MSDNDEKLPYWTRRFISGLCPCRSGRYSRRCCYKDGKWIRQPKFLSVDGDGRIEPKCIVADLGNCSGGISREHYISESVLRILSGDGGISLEGASWSENKRLVLPLSSLTSKILCRYHNQSLSPLDAAAKQFFTNFRQIIQKQQTPEIYGDDTLFLAAGEDIERWILKVYIGLAASKTMDHEKNKISGNREFRGHLLRLLYSNNSWPPPLGLYIRASFGEVRKWTPHQIAFRPVFPARREDTLIGLELDLLGMQFFVAFQEPPRRIPDGWNYRLKRININVPLGRKKVHHGLFFSWVNRS